MAHALTRIDLSSIVFFVGILLAVATLEHSKILTALANALDQVIGRQEIIVILLGLLSAIVDNVPLVAASMGMYDLKQYPVDSFLWEFIAYCAGTGGSILIIGSAAGVAAMGLEKIQFIWYMRKIGWLALLGYLAVPPSTSCNLGCWDNGRSHLGSRPARDCTLFYRASAKVRSGFVRRSSRGAFMRDLNKAMEQSERSRNL